MLKYMFIHQQTPGVQKQQHLFSLLRGCQDDKHWFQEHANLKYS